MSGNELFVDNPLALTGLYGPGIFLNPPEAEELPEAEAQQESKIVHFVDASVVTPAMSEIIEKVMSKTVCNGNPVQRNDYVMLSSGVEPDFLEQKIAELKPDWVMVWTDRPEALKLKGETSVYYRLKVLENTRLMQFHSPETVFSDQALKLEVWRAVKEMFGMK